MRIFIIHGWGGSPEEGWFPWLKEKLTAMGHEVFVPKMPDADNPKIPAWVNYLEQQIGQSDQNTILIGHSIGCQAILRYLETIETSLSRIILVAGWFKLKDLESDEEWSTARPWLDTPIDFDKIKQNSKSVDVILSDNDPWVPLEENKQIFEQKLGAQVHILQDKGHLGGDHDILEMPLIIDILNS